MKSISTVSTETEKKTENQFDNSSTGITEIDMKSKKTVSYRFQEQFIFNFSEIDVKPKITQVEIFDFTSVSQFHISFNFTSVSIFDQFQ